MIGRTRIAAAVFAAACLGVGGWAMAQPANGERGGQAGGQQGRAPEAAGGLIPRGVLFGNPERAAGRISPDGKHLAYLAPRDGVLNVWVEPVDGSAPARAVTNDTRRGIRQYFWAYTGEHILYLQDTDGDENFHLVAVGIANGEERALTPKTGVRVMVQEISEKSPDEIVVGLNDRVPQLHDLYRVNVRTGEKRLVQRNDGYVGFVTDDRYRVRMAARMTPEGGQELLKAAGPQAEAGENVDRFEPFITVGMEDALSTGPLAFSPDGKTLYMRDSRERDTAALVAKDLATGDVKVMAEDPRADVGGVLIHPTKKTIQAVSFNYDRARWRVLDRSIEPDLEALRAVADGEINVTTRTLDDRLWTVAYVLDNGPARTYLYDRETRQAKLLFTTDPRLAELQDAGRLARMHPVIIRSRDGLDLVSYLTLPLDADRAGRGRPARPVPMVLLVHGGPWARDVWGFNPTHQWLANRGYAVLSVNFRGSTGFGKRFVNAANFEWGKKMHDDLIDAVEWAVREGVAERDRVAIMGGSYGGYAALAGLTFTPETFAAGVSIVGPSNLVTLLNTIPPYWQPGITLFTSRVGDHRTEEGREFLESRSPLNFVERIQRPLLIGQGANDPRVKQSESDQIVSAMQNAGIPVTYVLYPDEGHGFARPENRMSFNAVTEAFLAQHLGGRFEPVGTDFQGSTIQVPAGKEGVPGLDAAMGGR